MKPSKASLKSALVCTQRSCSYRIQAVTERALIVWQKSSSDMVSPYGIAALVSVVLSSGMMKLVQHLGDVIGLRFFYLDTP